MSPGLQVSLGLMLPKTAPIPAPGVSATIQAELDAMPRYNVEVIVDPWFYGWFP